MKVKDFVGKKLELKIDERSHDLEMIADGKRVEELFSRVVVECSAGAVPIVTLSYFEVDQEGRLMEKYGVPVRGEMTFAIAGLAELNIIKESKPDDLTDSA